MTNPKHTDASRSDDLVAAMKDQLESWEFEDPRESWWKWQHQYAQAADRIEALEAALRDLVEAVQRRTADLGGYDGRFGLNKSITKARAALGEKQ